MCHTHTHHTGILEYPSSFSNQTHSIIYKTSLAIPVFTSASFVPRRQFSPPQINRLINVRYLIYTCTTAHKCFVQPSIFSFSPLSFSMLNLQMPYETEVLESTAAGQTIFDSILVTDQDSVGENLNITCLCAPHNILIKMPQTLSTSSATSSTPLSASTDLYMPCTK